MSIRENEQETGDEFAQFRNSRTRLLVAASLTVAIICAFSPQAFGSFGPPANFAVGGGPRSMAAGDLNGDGNLDLATANFDSDSVSLLIGDSTGSFGSGTGFSVGSSPTAVAIDDLNGDGKSDLVVAATTAGVSVRLGTGSGSFGQASTIGFGGSDPFSSWIPLKVAISDLNGDSNPDLAITTAAFISGPSYVSVALGTGTGTFGPVTNFNAGMSDSWPTAIAVEDLNGDSKPDAVVLSETGNKAFVLLGKGDGSFGQAQGFNVGSDTYEIAIGNLNNDDKPDLAVVYESQRFPPKSPDKVAVLFGNGDGSFGEVENLGSLEEHVVGDQPNAVAIGNLNDDGKADLAIANYGSGTVSVLLGNGYGEFGEANNIPGVGNPYSLVIGNLNGDNKPDLAVTDIFSDSVSVLLQNGSTFANGPPPGPSPPEDPVDPNQPDVPDVPTGTHRAKIKLQVKGPRRLKKLKKSTYTVKIRNVSGVYAWSVKVKVRGKGIRYRKFVGKVNFLGSRTLRVRLKPRKLGKVKIRFKVTSKNASRKIVRKSIRVRK